MIKSVSPLDISPKGFSFIKNLTIGPVREEGVSTSENIKNNNTKNIETSIDKYCDLIK